MNCEHQSAEQEAAFTEPNDAGCPLCLRAQLAAEREKSAGLERDLLIAIRNGGAAIELQMKDYERAVAAETSLSAALAAQKAAEERAEVLRDIIDDVQWCASDAVSEVSKRRYGLCPACYQDQHEGHHKGCSIGAALAPQAPAAEPDHKQVKGEQ